MSKRYEDEINFKPENLKIITDESAHNLFENPIYHPIIQALRYKYLTISELEKEYNRIVKEEIAKAIKEKINFEIYYADKGIPDPDQRNYEVSYQKIRDKGFETVISLEKGINELINGFQMLSMKNPYSNVSG